MKNTTLLFISRMITDTHCLIPFTSSLEIKVDGFLS